MRVESTLTHRWVRPRGRIPGCVVTANRFRVVGHRPENGRWVQKPALSRLRFEHPDRRHRHPPRPPALRRSPPRLPVQWRGRRLGRYNARRVECFPSDDPLIALVRVAQLRRKVRLVIRKVRLDGNLSRNLRGHALCPEKIRVHRNSGNAAQLLGVRARGCRRLLRLFADEGDHRRGNLPVGGVVENVVAGAGESLFRKFAPAKSEPLKSVALPVLALARFALVKSEFTIAMACQP